MRQPFYSSCWMPAGAAMRPADLLNSVEEEAMSSFLDRGWMEGDVEIVRRPIT